MLLVLQRVLDGKNAAPGVPVEDELLRVRSRGRPRSMKIARMVSTADTGRERKMTVLVTGSAGHLGEALMRTLRAASRPALGVDVKASAFTDRVGSICDRAFIEQCMRGVHTVIHSATLHKPHVVTHTKQDFIETNITGTLILLEAAVAAGVECFLYTSTTSTFGAPARAGCVFG